LEDRNYSQAKNLEKNKDSIRGMFASISPRYDLLNRLLSLGFDRIWRKKAAQITLSDSAAKILDVCAGTLDLSIAISSVNGFRGIVVATDFCKEMLLLGKKKIEAWGMGHGADVATEPYSASLNKRATGHGSRVMGHESRATGHERRIIPLCADTLNLPFKQNSFNAVTSAFGVRNIQALREALSEMRRVITGNGKAVILEFYRPKDSLLFSLYLFYFKKVLPLIGGIISRDKKAYSYLRDSVTNFLTQEEMKKEMELAGFRDVRYENLTFGIATIHVGIK